MSSPEDIARIISKRSIYGDDISERKQPIEEPWLVLTFRQLSKSVGDDEARDINGKEDETVHSFSKIDDLRDTNELVPEEEKSVPAEDTDSTIILI